MKRKISMLLCAVMVLGTLVGCGGNQAETKAETTQEETSKVASQEAEAAGDIENAGELFSIATTNSSAPVTVSGNTLQNVSYLMIYNPYVYDEADETGFPDPASLNTGDLSSQIIVGMNKAGGMGSDIEVPTTWSQAEINKDVDTTGVNREGVRAGALDPIYSLYDRQDFFHTDVTMQNTLKSTFDCYYEGEYCYIWSLSGSISEADAQMMGQEFDTQIYLKDVETFGTARFTDRGGKINLLFYPMKEGIGGYFTMADIFDSVEVPADMIEEYGFNVDHAIIHINSDYVLADPAYAKSTMTHEFQHLICASNCFNYSLTPWMETWLNEAMSAYAEELIYPGIKEQGYYNQFYYLSNNYRTGQSLYNFDTEFDEYIGAYGTVYLYSQYLEAIAGVDVYSKIHDYWRNSYSATVTEAETLANVIPAEVYNYIDTRYTYSDSINMNFENEYQAFISKLTLDFYLETLSPELANLIGYEDAMHASMIYSEINPVDIEGGGRIIVATQNGNYQVPADADRNLIYVALDANFEPVGMFSAQ